MALFDEKFEAWFNENYPHVNDPIIRAIAHCAWDSRWELLVEKFREMERKANDRTSRS